MVKQYSIICRGLEELADRLQGRDCWVTFEANGGEHWLQCGRGQINMDWPFSDPPERERLERCFGMLGPYEVVAWDIDLYVTINISRTETKVVALAIGRVFGELYEVGPDYDLSYKLEDV